MSTGLMMARGVKIFVGSVGSPCFCAGYVLNLILKGLPPSLQGCVNILTSKNFDALF